VPWGFPVSTLYHRYVYERHLERFGPALPSGWRRFGVPALRALIQIDRLFVGVERGALGFLLVATSR
jgi:hypothetical protein